VIPAFATENHFFDMVKTRRCLKQRQVLLLGDSTMGELFHDLAIILSGVGRNTTELNNYVNEATENKHDAEHYLWNYTLPEDTLVKFYCCRRNLTVDIPDEGIKLHFRFTGHYNLVGNYGGVYTFLDENFRDELICLLGLVKGCKEPDLIVINSGLHDKDFTSEEFSDQLEKFMIFLKDSYAEASKVMPPLIWKSNMIGCTSTLLNEYKASLEQLNADAFRIVTQNKNNHYVNITKITDYVHRWKVHHKHNLYTGDCIHYGSTARSKSFDHHGTISMLITQQILKEICESVFAPSPIANKKKNKKKN
jgi:hypothetical protein